MASNGTSKYLRGIGEISLRQLECFVAVAEEGRFVKAARRLRMAQPPVTRLIHRLERAFEAPLFDRTARGVQLTGVGQALIGPARRALAEVRRAAEAARAAAAGETGSLNIGFSSSAALSVMPDLIRRYRARHPDVNLILREATTADQLAQLEDAAIDIAVARGPVQSPAVISTALKREPFVAALPSGHPLARLASVPLARLGAERLIFIPRHVAPAFYDDVARACRKAGVTLVSAQEAAEWHTIVGLVGAGLGVSMTPASIEKLGWRAVAFRPLTGCRLYADLVVARREADVSPLVREFMQLAARQR